MLRWPFLTATDIRIGRSRRGGRGREQCDKALRERRVGQYRVTQRGIGQPRHHGNLRTRHDFSCVDTKGSEAELQFRGRALANSDSKKKSSIRASAETDCSALEQEWAMSMCRH